MDIRFVAGFGPIGTTDARSIGFWSGALGIEFEEPTPGYRTNDHLEGVKAFAIWPLDQAAESTFGSPSWPAELPVPQAWIEFDVESSDAVVAAAAELVDGGHRLLKQAGEEPWGQWTARLQSPEGLLVGVSFTPWMHEVATS
ncbi:MAG: glyoxalase [Microbacteriaceae bacterium]|nr:glyoxalase [Microbacteriaceae bacterium]